MGEQDAPKGRVPIPAPRRINHLVRSNTTVTSQENVMHTNNGNDSFGRPYSYLDIPMSSSSGQCESSLQLTNPQCPSRVTHLVRSNTTEQRQGSQQYATGHGHKMNIYAKTIHASYDAGDNLIDFGDSDMDIPSSSFEKPWKSSLDISKYQGHPPPPMMPANDLHLVPPRVPPRITPRQNSSPIFPSQANQLIEYGSKPWPLQLDSNGVSDSSIKHKMGWLQKLGKSSENKDYGVWTKFWCTVNEKYFSIAEGKDLIPINSVTTSNILTVVKKLDIIQQNNMNMYCFTVVDTITKSDQARLHTFGTNNAKERDSWIASIWMCITPSTNVADSLITAVDKAGRFEYKESVSGIWQAAWLGLLHRNLELWVDDGAQNINVDLRKVKSLYHLTNDPGIDSSADEIFKGTVFSLTYEGFTIYLRSPVSSETDDTFKLVMAARNTIGSEIEDQFLTKNDIPVIVELCLNFIFVHGMTIEGIYTNDVEHLRAETLLKALQTDPYNVNLSSHVYTVHEVASCLKLFFSKLVEPLLSDKLASGWRAAYAAQDKDRIMTIQPLIHWLTPVQNKTLRLLLLHLRSVSKCQERNNMSELRIADVFGPILIGGSNEIYKGWDTADVGRTILLCLLQYFVTLFKVTEAELQHEETCLKYVLQSQTDTLEKASLSKSIFDNGILVTVAVDHQLWGKTLAFKVYSKMTARDVCEHMMIVLKRPVRIESVILCEVVCNNELVRPIHFSELVFEVLIRWKNWDHRESSKNCLLFKYDDIYQKIMPYVPTHTSVWFSGEIRLADATARSSFKKVWLKFEKVLSDNVGQLSYLKDSMAFKPISSWRINDVTWYIGSESRRQSPTKFAFTFIERIAAVQRTKSRPYFGFTVCMKTEEELLKWMAVMMKGEYPNGLLPT